MSEHEALEYHSAEFRDLAKLAKERSRRSVSSVMQLIESDAEKAALLVFIAIDLIEGAVIMITNEEGEDEAISKTEALGHILGMIFSILGKDRVASALKATLKEKSTGRKR